MTHASLFTGIGGFDLAAEWCGFENIFQVEIDKFCLKLLNKRFPNAQKFKDIKEFDGRPFRGRVDIISGGFPCQPFSVAGKRKGKTDDRYLWPEMLRVIQEIKPRWVVGENVAGFIEMGLEQSWIDLENEGYEVQPIIIPACAVNAPHRRDRVWIIGCNAECGAFNRQSRRRAGEGFADGHTQFKSNLEYSTNNAAINKLFDSHSNSEHSEKHKRGNKLRQARGEGASRRGVYEPGWKENWFEVATRLCRVDDGVSDRVHRLRGLGNAIVPQVAVEIFQAIKNIEEMEAL